MIRSLARMMAAAALCVVAMPLAGCMTPVLDAGAETAAIDQLTPIERAEAAYGRLRGASEILLLVLPEPYAGQVRIWRGRADRALDLARTANDATAQLRALRQLEAAAKKIENAAAHEASANTERAPASRLHPS